MHGHRKTQSSFPRVQNMSQGYECWLCAYIHICMYAYRCKHIHIHTHIYNIQRNVPNALWRLQCHFNAVLKNRYRESIARVTCEPQAELWVSTLNAEALNLQFCVWMCEFVWKYMYANEHAQHVIFIMWMCEYVYVDQFKYTQGNLWATHRAGVEHAQCWSPQPAILCQGGCVSIYVCK